MGTLGVTQAVSCHILRAQITCTSNQRPVYRTHWTVALSCGKIAADTLLILTDFSDKYVYTINLNFVVPHAYSGSRSSYGKRAWFTESHTY